MIKFTLTFLSLLKQAYIKLKVNDPLILASSTAFFTTFSLIPILVILVNVLGLYFKNQELKFHLTGQLQELFGRETGRYLQAITSKINNVNHNWLITMAGILFLFFVATNLLKVVKLAINRIWNVKRKHVSKLKYTLMERAVALGIIFLTAALVGVSILLDTTAALMNNYLRENLPSIDLLLIRALRNAFSLAIITIWFAMNFKVLPDAKLHWRVAFVGGLFTALLFNAGKWALGKLLIYSTIANIFGASASMALILLFIFYSSFILYYGAAFTLAFGKTIGKPVLSGKYSEKYEVVVVKDDPEQ